MQEKERWQEELKTHIVGSKYTLYYTLFRLWLNVHYPLKKYLLPSLMGKVISKNKTTKTFQPLLLTCVSWSPSEHPGQVIASS